MTTFYYNDDSDDDDDDGDGDCIPSATLGANFWTSELGELGTIIIQLIARLPGDGTDWMEARCYQAWNRGKRAEVLVI